MAAEPAISVSNLSKAYPLFDRPWDRLRHLLTGRQPAREFQALSGVSFEVAKGESVGIIGRNGSGKSTLLQIIAGTLAPGGGEVSVSGRVVALLELGSGFNPEFTGRENVYLNGAIWGCSRAQMDEVFDEIAAFADIGDFIDEPVKEYSSGMMMRLAFAVQVSLKPEILIVDEALAVGDYFFQQKCFSRLRRMRDEGLTLLFVSHDLGVVRDICTKALLLADGNQVFFGDSKEAIRLYLADSVSKEEAREEKVDEAFAPDASMNVDQLMFGAIWRCKKENDAAPYILAVAVLDAEGAPTESVEIGGVLRFKIVYRNDPARACHPTLLLKNRMDQVVCSVGSYNLGVDVAQLSDDSSEFAQMEFEMICNFEAGNYAVQVVLGEPTGPNQGRPLDATDWFGPLCLRWDYGNQAAPFLGMFGPPVKASVKGLKLEKQ